MDMAWSSRDNDFPLQPEALVARVEFFAHGHIRSLFSL
jgi:hypothetical protein